MHTARLSVAIRLAAIVLSVAVAAACGENGSGPAEPGPSSVVGSLLTPPGLTVTFLPSADGHNLVRISWGPVERATRYVVEAGTSPGFSSNLLSVQTSSMMHEWVDAPPGISYVRVKARNDTQTSIASAERSVAVFDFRDFVEAIFLGTGPFADNVNPSHGCFRSVYSRFRVGARIKVRMSTSIPGGDIAAARAEIELLQGLTHGLDLSFEITDDPNPLPADGEVTLAALPQTDVARLCGGGATGCAINTFPTAFPTGLLRSVRIVAVQQSPSHLYFHEAGHGVFGLCHAQVGDSQTLMFNASLVATHFSDFDRMAVDAVFGAAMAPGASRADFAARGLVRP